MSYNWREVKLGDVVDEITVGHVGTMVKHYRETGVPFLRSLNVLPHRLDLTDVKFIDPDFERGLSKSRLRPNDVVIVRTGKPGTTAVIPETLPMANCSDLVIVRPGSSVDARWLSYYMNASATSFVSAHLVGAVQQHFNVGSAKNLQLALPGLPEQRAIADLLGALDDKIAANRQVAETAEALARLIFARATAALPRVPFPSKLTPILGGTPSRSNPSFWGGGHLWISATDVTGADHGVILTTREKISGEAVARTKAKPLPRGSVILTARGTVGAVARLAEPASFNQSAYGFRPNGISPALLYFSVLDAAEQAANFVHGSVFDTITMRTFGHLTVPNVDQVVADPLEMRLSALLDVVEHSVRESAALAATRDAFLPGLMSGKLRVRDAERVAEELT